MSTHSRMARLAVLAVAAIAFGGVASAQTATPPNIVIIWGDDIGQFRGFSRIGQHQRHIALGHHAQIAMAGLGRMHEMRRAPELSATSRTVLI